MKKLYVLILMMCIFMMTGCGNASIGGTWVEVRQIDSNGNVTMVEDIPMVEIFEIEGDKSKHTIHSKDDSMKDITLTYNPVKISDTEYKLMAGNFEFGIIT